MLISQLRLFTKRRLPLISSLNWTRFSSLASQLENRPPVPLGSLRSSLVSFPGVARATGSVGANFCGSLTSPSSHPRRVAYRFLRLALPDTGVSNENARGHHVVTAFGVGFEVGYSAEGGNEVRWDRACHVWQPCDTNLGGRGHQRRTQTTTAASTK